MSLDELVGGPARPTGTNQARGRVSRAPATATDPLEVTLVNVSAVYPYEVPPSNWQPRGTSLPAVGDRCLVSFDDDGDAWISVWGDPAGETGAGSGQGAPGPQGPQGVPGATGPQGPVGPAALPTIVEAINPWWDGSASLGMLNFGNATYAANGSGAMTQIPLPSSADATVWRVYATALVNAQGGWWTPIQLNALLRNAVGTQVGNLGSARVTSNTDAGSGSGDYRTVEVIRRFSLPANVGGYTIAFYFTCPSPYGGYLYRAEAAFAQAYAERIK